MKLLIIFLVPLLCSGINIIATDSSPKLNSIQKNILNFDDLSSKLTENNNEFEKYWPNIPSPLIEKLINLEANKILFFKGNEKINIKNFNKIINYCHFTTKKTDKFSYEFIKSICLEFEQSIQSNSFSSAIKKLDKIELQLNKDQRILNKVTILYNWLLKATIFPAKDFQKEMALRHLGMQMQLIQKFKHLSKYYGKQQLSFENINTKNDNKNIEKDSIESLPIKKVISKDAKKKMNLLSFEDFPNLNIPIQLDPNYTSPKTLPEFIDSW